jgi:uncharacterized membrane protein HdeD (DUF308 family)
MAAFESGPRKPPAQVTRLAISHVSGVLRAPRLHAAEHDHSNRDRPHASGSTPNLSVGAPFWSRAGGAGLAQETPGVIARGVALVGLGVAAFMWPERSLAALVTLVGAAALIGGIGALASRQLRLVAAFDLILALLVFVYPRAEALALLWPVAVAAWAILTGVAQLRGQRLQKASGVASILAGLVLAAVPLQGTDGILWAVGTYGFVAGALMPAAGFETRRA